MSSKKRQSGRLIVVSNRLPVSISKRKGQLNIQPSPGGLATALRGLQQDKEVLFIGWPGYIPTNSDEKDRIVATLRKEHQSIPVFLSRYELDKYYYGFANRTLWPLFHYFSSYCTFEQNEWETYVRVNQNFFKEIVRSCESSDTFWVHDYHLMLLPHLLREYFRESKIGFFLHIPFPSSEIFRTLPWRKEILEGLLGADLVGFHTYEYARHFLSSVLRLLGFEHEFGLISVEDRFVNVDNYPMGVDTKKIIELLEKRSVQKEILRCQKMGCSPDCKIMLSVDRLDYSKGIPQRLRAFEQFLSKRPEWHSKIIYIMLCVPSRTKVRDYALLKQEVESLVGRVNGRFGSTGWMPVHYMYRSLPFHKLVPLYAAADVALVTPIRDGMNLVAKEYVAAQKDNRGVLILSGTAGASAELGEAIEVNVFSREEIVSAIAQALEMPQEEQVRRMKTMRQRILEYDLQHWTRSFIEGIHKTEKLQSQKKYRKLGDKWRKKLLAAYKTSQKRLLLLDYDGTLISFAQRPEDAKPDIELKRLLLQLASKELNHLTIISGRDRKTMEQWLGDIPCTLVAEHGAWFRHEARSDWETEEVLTSDWKSRIKPILKEYASQVPGSRLEEKEFGLAWHFRKANPELGEIRSHQLYDNLNEYLASTDLQVMHGNKVIEVRAGSVNKGIAAQKLMSGVSYDFILAVGDDWTDEDLFKALPEKAYSIKIGYGATQARFFLDSPKACRLFLHELARA